MKFSLSLLLASFYAVEVAHPQSAIHKGDYKLLYFLATKEGLLFDLKNDLG